MKLPKPLLTIIILLVILSFAGLFIEIFSVFKILEQFANFALILTLAAILIYVYYTYLIAKDAWTPHASFVLMPYPSDLHHFAFLIQNHSKVSLKCWCNLNATVNGQDVFLDGFYNGQSSFDLQPFGAANGHFAIQDILTKANLNIQVMKKKATSDNLKKQLYLNIDFWYSADNNDKKIHNSNQPYYFDFARDVIVLDF